MVDIQSAKLVCDGSGMGSAWHMDYCTVTNVTTGNHAKFVYRWVGCRYLSAQSLKVIALGDWVAVVVVGKRAYNGGIGGFWRGAVA